jgi:hypothetical protein
VISKIPTIKLASEGAGSVNDTLLKMKNPTGNKGWGLEGRNKLRGLNDSEAIHFISHGIIIKK